MVLDLTAPAQALLSMDGHQIVVVDTQRDVVFDHLAISKEFWWFQ